MITHLLMIIMHMVVTMKTVDDNSNMCKDIVIETDLM